MKKAAIWVIAVGLVLLLGFRVSQRLGQRGASSVAEEERTVPVKAIAVTMSSIREIVSFTGDVKGKDQVNVYSEVPGRIREYAVKEGQWVSKDGLIATVDRAITGLDFEPAKVRSPIAGMVGRTFLDRGDAVAPQVPVALVVRMNEVEVVVNVVERDMPKVRPGLKATVKIDAQPDTSFEGVLSTLSPVVDPMSRTAVARIRVDNRRGLLKPGMFARVDLVIKKVDKAVVVPADAVLGKDDHYAFVVEAGRAVRRAVEVGIREGASAEVKSGLNEGDTLIVMGQRVVQAGENVNIVLE